MLQEVVFAGFGGQGVLLAAQLLANAGMLKDLDVAWIPSYGPEMRGGTAAASVVISDQEIGSLVVEHPDAVVIMNDPSFDKYVPRVKPGGIVLYNSSLITRKTDRKDLRLVPVPALDVAIELGNDRLANMVMLGATIGALAWVPIEAVYSALEKTMVGRKARFLESNKSGVSRGLDFGLGGEGS